MKSILQEKLMEDNTEKEVMEKDNERTAHLNQKGIRVIRFWNNDVLEHTNEVLKEIYATVK